MRSKITAIKWMRPRKFILCAAAALLTLALAGCGGSSAPKPNPNPTSGLAKRVLLSNTKGGAVTNGVQTAGPGDVMILDASKDQLSNFTISIPGASKLFTAGGFTAVIDSTQNVFAVLDNTKEQAVQASATGDRVVDVQVSKDGKTAYGAIRNTGTINAINTSDGTTNTISLPSVSRLVLSPNGTKLLAFVDDPNLLSAPNTGGFFVIDTATRAVTGIAGPKLDQPFTGVFNNSETQAFILNCGAECGGTAASVVSVDFSGATPVFGTPIPVSAATVGLLSGSNLFVAGTPSGSASGTLQTINTGSLTASAPVTITDGHHLKMVLVSNNRLYVGAVACTTMTDVSTGLIRGCLAIVNTGSSAVVFPEFPTIRSAFDVTGIQPISNRNVVYVCEGGELDIYDTTTDKLTSTQLDILGQAIDVVQIDP